MKNSTLAAVTAFLLGFALTNAQNLAWFLQGPIFVVLCLALGGGLGLGVRLGRISTGATLLVFLAFVSLEPVSATLDPGSWGPLSQRVAFVGAGFMLFGLGLFITTCDSKKT